MTSLKQALQDAGYQTSEGVLREIAMQALYAYPTDPYGRRRAIMDGIGDSAPLLRLLFERHVAEATDRLVAAVRNDMLVNARTGRHRPEAQTAPARAAAVDSGNNRFDSEAQFHVGDPAADADAGDQDELEARKARVPGPEAGTGDQLACEARPVSVPGAGAPEAGAPGAGARAVAAVVRLSLLDTFRVNGQPLGDVSAAEARLWAEARGRQARRDARFIELITAGLPDGMPIRRFRRDDEAQAAWAEALRETI